jgi:two-component system chemotaxis sensor kinase CheA
VVRTNVERLKGGIRVVSTPGEGCRFEMHFPLTLATTRVLIAELGGFKYAVPVEFVRRGLKVDREAVFLVEGRPTVMVDGHAVSVVDLAAILELRQGAEAGLNNRRRLDKLLCIVIELGNERMGLFVDALVDEQEVVLKPNNGLLKRVRNVSGATILGTGEVCMVLNPADMLQSLRRGAGGDHFHQQVENMEATRQAILLVEDSITTRTQEKRILEGAGYEVVVAVDGLDGYAKLGTRPFDAVITDVEMPNMSGLELAEKIRLDERYRELPIILVTSLASEEDQKRGVEAGANAYITKGRFEQKVLLDTLGRLI